jgi:hypothetical protein
MQQAQRGLQAMRRIGLSTSLIATVGLALGLTQGLPAAHAAKPVNPKPDPMAGVRTWPAGTPVAVSLTVYPRHGDVGRSSGVYSKYRPQMRFHGGQELTCELTLPGKDALIEPGATGDAHITCNEAFKTHKDSPTFQMREGGRVVGEGRVTATQP